MTTPSSPSSLPPLPPLTAVLVAGGRARRMGGGSKGLLKLGGRPLAAHVLERLVPWTEEILINANADLQSWERFGHPVFADAIGDFAGPLAGVHGAMTRACRPLLVFLPCDTPFLPFELVPRLVDTLERSGAEIAVARTPARVHPLCFACRRTLLPSIEQFLKNGGRSVSAWQDQHFTVEVGFDDEAAFRNLNTPAELAEAAAAHPGGQPATAGDPHERI